MTIVLGIVWLAVTAYVWWRFGAPPGVLAAVATIPVFGLILRGVTSLSPGRRERAEFVKALEERGGRMGLESGATDMVAANRLYREWRNEDRDSSAAEWLENRGYHRTAKGWLHLRSPWKHDIWHWPPEDSSAPYVAAAWFPYERGGQFGSAGNTHFETCGHLHDSEDEARPCLRRLQAVGGLPTLEDLERRDPRFDADPIGGQVEAVHSGLPEHRPNTQVNSPAPDRGQSFEEHGFAAIDTDVDRELLAGEFGGLLYDRPDDDKVVRAQELRRLAQIDAETRPTVRRNSEPALFVPTPSPTDIALGDPATPGSTDIEVAPDNKPTPS